MMSGQQDALDHVVSPHDAPPQCCTGCSCWSRRSGQRAPIRGLGPAPPPRQRVWLGARSGTAVPPPTVCKEGPLLSDPPRHQARLKTHLVFRRTPGMVRSFPPSQRSPPNTTYLWNFLLHFSKLHYYSLCQKYVT